MVDISTAGIVVIICITTVAVFVLLLIHALNIIFHITENMVYLVELKGNEDARRKDG